MVVELLKIPEGLDKYFVETTTETIWGARGERAAVVGLLHDLAEGLPATTDRWKLLRGLELAIGNLREEMAAEEDTEEERRWLAEEAREAAEAEE